MIIDKLFETINKLGLKKSDIILLHIDTDVLNNKNIKNKEHCSNILDTLLYGIGENGTIVTPSFNYDFCKTSMFNIETTPSQVGYFSNFLLSKKNSFRSCHPIFSFVAIGKYAKEITSNISNDSFGKESVFDRLCNLNAKGLYLNLKISNPDGPPCTIIHYIEQKYGINYRFLKNFPGFIINNKKKFYKNFTYNVRNLDLDVRTDNMKLYYECVKNDFMKYYLLEDKYPISFCDLNNVVSTGLKLLNKNKFGLLEKDPYKIKKIVFN